MGDEEFRAKLREMKLTELADIAQRMLREAAAAGSTTEESERRIRQVVGAAMFRGRLSQDADPTDRVGLPPR